MAKFNITAERPEGNDDYAYIVTRPPIQREEERASVASTVGGLLLDSSDSTEVELHNSNLGFSDEYLLDLLERGAEALRTYGHQVTIDAPSAVVQE